MGKTIRETINHSNRNHTVNRHRTQNRRRKGVRVEDPVVYERTKKGKARVHSLVGEFTRAKRYQRNVHSWNPRPHGRAFEPKGVVASHVDSARKRRDQKRLRKDYLDTLVDTLQEKTLEHEFHDEADNRDWCEDEVAAILQLAAPLYEQWYAPRTREERFERETQNAIDEQYKRC